jgi:hypothetical protein
LIRFGSGGCQNNHPECCQSQKEKSFHIVCFFYIRRNGVAPPCCSHARIRLLPEASSSWPMI